MWKWAPVVAFLLLLAVVGLMRDPEGGRVRREAAAPVDAAPAAAAASPAAGGEVLRLPDSSVPHVVVRGVVRGDGRLPLAGARVQNDARTFRTGADGAFAIEMARFGGRQLRVEADGYMARTASRRDDNRPLEILMQRGAYHARLRVVDEHQRPVAGAACDLSWGDACASGTTDAAGLFEVAHIGPDGQGSASVTVQAPGFVPALAPLVIAAPDLVDGGTFVLARGGVVHGVVRDKRTGAPVAGVSVKLCWSPVSVGPAITDAAGAYRLEHAPLAGQCWLEASGDGFLPDRKGGGFDYENPLFPEGETEVARDVWVERSVRAEGTVVDAGGDAVSGATVSIHGQGALTDARGRFAFGQFYPDDEEEAPLEACSAGGRARLRVIPGRGPVVVRLAPTCRVTGRVVDREGRPDERDWSLSLRQDAWWEPLQREEGGRFCFPNVSAGTWKLSLRCEGCLPYETTFFVDAREPEIALGDLTLDEGGEITGQLLDDRGQPFADVRVGAHHAFRGVRATVTDEQGRFRLTGFQDDEPWELKAACEGWYLEPVPVQRGRTGLRCTLRRTLRARGRVLVSGRPLAGARVVCSAGKGQARTDDDGTFEVRELWPGRTFRLTFTSDRAQGLVVDGVEPWEGVRDFTLERGRVLQGRVRDEQGAPLPGIHLLVRVEGRRGVRNACSGADGCFEAAGLEAGPIIVELGANPGYAPGEPLRLAAGADSCEITARRGHRFSVILRRPGGEAPDEVNVIVTRPDGGEVTAAWAWSWESETLEFEGLLPGRYHLAVTGIVEGDPPEVLPETAIDITVPGPPLEVQLR